MKKVRFFKTVVVRTPAFGVQTLDTLDILDAIRNNQAFIEALCVANPEIYGLCISLLNGEITDPGKKSAITVALTNYYLRMSTNPTPFGLFAKLGTVSWADGLSDLPHSRVIAKTRLDMSALHALLSYLHRDSIFMAAFKYFPNNTIYVFDGQYRYIEKIEDRYKSTFNISAIACSDIVKSIIECSAPGKTLAEVILFLRSGDYSDYSAEELNSFLQEMISSQVLCSELQLNVTGDDPISYISALILNRTGKDHPLLTEISLLLMEANKGSEQILAARAKIYNVFERLGIKVEEKFLLQTDTFDSEEAEPGFLDMGIQRELENAIQILNYFEQPEYVPKLETFKKLFYERYEDSPVPLLEALDTDAGIGFGHFTHRSDNVLLDESVVLRTKPKTGSTSPVHRSAKLLLTSRFISTLSKGEYSMNLNIEDFEHIKPASNRMAKTFQVMFNLWGSQGGLINFHTAGHASAGNLLGRFGYGNEMIQKTLKEIANCEDRSYPGAAVAEIVHLPEARIGNLSYRPKIRDLEIPIINHSTTSYDQQIALGDLYLVLRSGRLILLSKSRACEVVPKLTSAHNYNRHTSPVYQLLSELQYQDMIPSISLNLGDLNYMGNFIPRIQCGRVILSRAKWVFGPKEIAFWRKNEQYSEIMSEFRSNWRIPRFVHFIDGKTETFLDWENPILVSHFLDAISNLKEVVLFEFCLDTDNNVLTNKNGEVVLNQFIAFGENLEREHIIMKPETVGSILNSSLVPAKIFPGNEWLYLKVYCSVSYSDKILSSFIATELVKLRTEGLVKKFFFIRYNDPLYHLRLRFECLDAKATAEVMERVGKLLQDYQQMNIVYRIALDTYSREMERYGQKNILFCESIFEASSNFWLSYLSVDSHSSDYYLPMIFLYSLDSLLKGMGLAAREQMQVLSEMAKGYEREFGVTDNKELQKLVNGKEKAHRKILEDMLEEREGNILKEPAFSAISSMKTKLFDQVLKITTSYAVDKQTLLGILPSLMHMHAIRGFKTKPRENELFAYSLLYAYYKKKSFKVNV